MDSRLRGMTKNKNMRQTKQKRPLVSVIMPVYNAGAYLVEAIESILDQTFTDFEFIIVDDASTDNSVKIIGRYAKKYPKKIIPLFLTKNRNNGGDACANEGYKIARGKFIARMDADDIAHPNRLEKQLAYMKNHPGVIVLGTQALVIDKEGRVTGEKHEPTTHEEIRKNYCIYHPMIHPSVMIRRRLLPKRNYLYNIRYNANNDLLTFFELLQYGEFTNLPDKLLYYRIHGKNDSLINPKEKFMNTIKIRLLAWKDLGYRPTFYAIGMNILQFLAVLILPSSVVTSLYMTWKGLLKPQVKSAALTYATNL